MPTAEAPPGGANSANFGSVVNAVTPVGAYAGSASFYGTFDQGGNVIEWCYAPVFPTTQPMRGGAWIFGADRLASSSVLDIDKINDLNDSFGFRVASP